MIVKLHKNARTTPAIRAQLAASNEPVAVLAKRFNLAPNTVRKWQSRTDFNDRSHTAHNLQTTLNSAQEQIVIYLRKQLLLPLDDLLSVTREFLCPEVSRSGLNRCLRRHNVGNLREMTRTQDNKPKYQRFKDYSIGYVHIDVKYLPQMPDETKRRYLFVAIDRATRMVCVQLRHSKTANDAKAFLKSVTERFPFKVSKVLTDNGKEFTNKVFGQKAADNTHEFDLLCQSLGIEHRLTKVRRPQTNGMVERFNGRIADILRTHHFQSGKELEHTLKRYIDLYNNHLPQANLNCRTPCQVMFEWYEKKPQSFNKPVHNRTEGDNYGNNHNELQNSTNRVEEKINTTLANEVSEEKIKSGEYFDYRFLQIAADLILLEEDARGNRQIRGYTATMLTRLDFFLDNTDCVFMRSSNDQKNVDDYLSCLWECGENDQRTQLVIIDTSELSPDILETLTSVTSRLLFDDRKKLSGNKRREEPIHLILDEAHRYIKKNYDYLLNENIFEKIAREGRKFSLFLLVSSQRPSELSETVLSQCANFIVHRIQNETDMRYIQAILPYFSDDFTNKIKQSTPGEALVFGNCVSMPLHIKVQEANPSPDSKNCNIPEQWFVER